LRAGTDPQGLFSGLSSVSTMIRGWRYRLVTVGGVVALTVLVVLSANSALLHGLVRGTPYVGAIPDSPRTAAAPIQVGTAVLVFLAAFVPLYKPRPRRILDVLEIAVRRTVTAAVWLAAISYMTEAFGLDRLTIVVAGALAIVALPAWFVAVRRRPAPGSSRAIVVGNDVEQIRTVLASTDRPFVGYVASTTVADASERTAAPIPDGGPAPEPVGIPCLGGLTRLDEVLVEHDIDATVLAFDRPDREEFFGALDVCYAHGVTATVHRSQADWVLTTGVGSGELAEVDLEPWDWQDHLLKRVFDVGFATVGMVLLAPVILAVAVTVRVDDGRPVIYSQTRTTTFGDTFTVRKFRTMADTGTDAVPIPDATNAPITRVGGVLRELHLDELPQLWSILVGDMSVVGPRAAWTEEETLLEGRAASWRKRWFVPPGLTGLAQINDVSSTDPAAKLQYDMEYIRRQSFWYDLKIVIRQLWRVGVDIVRVFRGWLAGGEA
jgi:lipopolysaccharide/colanic/teichoic acid biosynthesis glycosyltransferase